jgi:hypothetical protein
MDKTHKEKWLSSMIAKYGSEEAVREVMATNARKASHTKPQGFAVMKARGELDKIKELSKRGVKARQRSNDETTN